jgi:uncharacterized membrane protein YeaQ/YmgE (transglycosylase-associated protein family)
MTIAYITIILLVCGIIAAVIGQARGSGAVMSFLFGAIFGLIGIALLAVLPAGRTSGAEWGGRRIKCTCCGARQDIAIEDKRFDCRRCGRHHVLIADAWRLGLREQRAGQ